MSHSLSDLERQHEEAAYAALDRQAERQDALEAAIDAEAETYMNDDDTVEGFIAENADVVWGVLKRSPDSQLKHDLMVWVKHWAQTEAEVNINE